MSDPARDDVELIEEALSNTALYQTAPFPEAREAVRRVVAERDQLARERDEAIAHWYRERDEAAGYRTAIEEHIEWHGELGHEGLRRALAAHPQDGATAEVEGGSDQRWSGGDW